jgi:hypothetical protein
MSITISKAYNVHAMLNAVPTVGYAGFKAMSEHMPARSHAHGDTDMCMIMLLLLQELLDAQLAAAVAAAAAAGIGADSDADDGHPSAPLIDLAGETTTEVPASLRTDDEGPAS